MIELDRELEEMYGDAGADLALNEINVLFCTANEDKAIYVVEYKWWYGNGPNDSRWQRVCIECPVICDPLQTYGFILDRVEEIRKALVDKTGVPQDVRH